METLLTIALSVGPALAFLGYAARVEVTDKAAHAAMIERVHAETN